MNQRFFVPAARPTLLEPLFFLRWWYGRALYSVVLIALYHVAVMEDRFSLLLMLRQIFLLQPLHQDYSAIGRVIGVVIRLLWSVVGGAVIFLVIVFALLEIALWIALPLALLLGFVRGWFL